MPDVGTLYIEISSNADTAAKGLGTLATKLGSVKKNAEGFDLSNVQTQITNIVNAVKGSEKTMASLGTLFNATATYFKAFGKITDKISVNTKPIEDLKKAFGEGIKTGNVGSQLNQLRIALEGEWRTDNAYNAGMALSAISQGAKDAESTNLASVASNVSAVAKALNEYADASARIKEVSGVEGIKTAFETLGTNAGTGYVQGMESMKIAVSDASAKTIEAGYEAGADAQQSHSPSLLYEQLGAYAGEGYVEGIRSKISAVTAIVSEMVQAAIASSEGKTAQVAQAVSATIKTAFESALSGMDLSDVQKSMIQRTANLTADVVRSFAETSKASLEDTAKISSGIVSSAMAGATSKALDSMQPLQDGIQQFNSELQTSGTYVENNIDEGIKESVKETAEMNERLQMTNEELQEQLRIRKEILDAQNQARLESNYGLYRELYMSGEGDWKQQVPEMYGFTDKAIEANETYADALKATLQEVNTYVDTFIEKQNAPAGPLLSDFIDQADNAKLAMKQASESAAVLRNAPEVTELSSGMQQVQSASQTMNSSLEQTKTATRVLTDDMKNLDKEMKQKKPDALKAKDGIDKFKFSLKDLNNGIKAAFPLLSSLGSRLKSIVIRRTLTAMLRKIVSGAKEGLQNVYEYSKVVGTSFAPAMDSAASSIATMKNALGAALSPVVQALIPVLQTVVNWFIDLVNYANQFFALLNGQNTWTRALPQTANAFDKQKKAAKGAAAAMKDLLADWDELNIIQSQTNGGSGGGTAKAAEDYLNMFEEVNVFDDKVKKAVQFIKDNFADILLAVGAIKAAMSSWRISSALAKHLPFIAKIAEGIALGAVVSLSLVVTDVLGKAYVNSSNPAFLIADALTGGLGAFLAGKIATKIAGGVAGTVTSGFTLVLEGLVNIKNAAKAASLGKDSESWALGALGSVEGGIGTALIAKGLFGLGTAGTITAGVISGSFLLALTAIAILDAKNAASNRDMAYAAFAKKGKNGISPQDYLYALQSRFSELTEGATLVVDAIMGFDDSKGKFKESIEQLKSLNTFITSGASLTEDQATKFKNAWDIVFEELNKLGEMSYESVFAGLEEALHNGTKDIQKAAAELKVELIEIAKLTGGARASAEEEMRQYVQELSVGNTEHLDRYLELYNVWGGTDTEKDIKEYKKKALEKNIEFNEENPVQDVIDFINSINESAYNPAKELIDQQYESELKGIEEQRDEINKAQLTGIISKDQADDALSALDKIAKLFDERHQQQLDEAEKIRTEAYDKIAEQLRAGYFDSELDEQSRQSYIDNVINPVVKAMEDAGVELPQSIKDMIDIVQRYGQYGVQNANRNQEYADTFGRKEAYSNLIEAYMTENEYTDLAEADSKELLRYIIASMSELSQQGQYESLTDIDKQDIINSLVSVIPDYMTADILEMLSSKEFDIFGGPFADLEQLLSWINWSSLGGREGEVYGYTLGEEELVYSIEDLNEYIAELIEKYNYNNPSNPITGDQYWATPNQNGQAGVITEEDIAKGVADGTERGNTEQNAILDGILRGVEAIVRKQFVVNIGASAALGIVNGASAVMASKITGNGP